LVVYKIERFVQISIKQVKLIQWIVDPIHHYSVIVGLLNKYYREKELPVGTVLINVVWVQPKTSGFPAYVDQQGFISLQLREKVGEYVTVSLFMDFL
jgi:hypothetical protein